MRVNVFIIRICCKYFNAKKCRAKYKKIKRISIPGKEIIWCFGQKRAESRPFAFIYYYIINLQDAEHNIIIYNSTKLYMALTHTHTHIHFCYVWSALSTRRIEPYTRHHVIIFKHWSLVHFSPPSHCIYGMLWTHVSIIIL